MRTHSQTSWETQQKTKRKYFTSQRGWEHSLQNQMGRANQALQRLDPTMDPSWVCTRHSEYTPGVFVGWLILQVGMLLTLLCAYCTYFLLLACLIQPWYKSIWLVLLHYVMVSSVDIIGISALFWREMQEQLIWGKWEMKGFWDRRKVGLWLGWIIWKNNKWIN